MDTAPADDDPYAALLGRLEAAGPGSPTVELEAILVDAGELKATLCRERDLCERALVSQVESEASSISSVATTLLRIRLLNSKIVGLDDALASLPHAVP